MAYKDPAEQQAWRDAHKDGHKDYLLRRMYGITLEEYQEMVLRQKGLCAICGRMPVGKHNQAVLHVDHDHETGRVRGLLCSHCNRGLGFFRESADLLRAAVDYLADEGGGSG